MSEVADQYAAAQAAEYGTYVANGPITIDGALAFNTDHPVPASTVEARGWLLQELVRRVGDPLPEPPEQAAPVLGEPIVLTPPPDEPEAVPADPSADPGDVPSHTEDEV